FDAHLPIFSIFIFFTLIITPALYLLSLLYLWLSDHKPHQHRILTIINDAISSWAMLDVFGLALFIFLTEGKSLIRTSIQPGLYALCFFILIMRITAALMNRSRKHILNKLQVPLSH
ncbi:MAG: paraquat-inducible protein A, partial [Desulfobacterales bacterium]|nr:paraquat-inducible protein A [Desulfobacterales bacterium]